VKDALVHMVVTSSIQRIDHDWHLNTPENLYQ